MKNSIITKVKKHTVIMGCIASVSVTVLIVAVLLFIRQFIISEGDKLVDLASQDAKDILVTQAEVELMRIVINKAQLTSYQLISISEDVQRMAAAADGILRDTRFSPRQAMELLRTHMLNNMLLNVHDDRAYYYGTEQGEFFVADSTEIIPTNIDMRGRPWYISAKAAGRLIWTDIYPDQEGRGQSITCAMPYYAPNGNIAGVAGMGTTIAAITEIISGEVGETGQTFVLDANGNIIIAKDLKYDNQGKPYIEYLSDDLSEALPAIAERVKKGESGIERVIMQGEDKLMAFCGIENMPWCIVVLIDAEETISSAQYLEENVNNLKLSTVASYSRQILIITVISIFVLVIINLCLMMFYNRLARSITDPIQKLTKDAAIIEKGADHILEIHSGDELEILANTFNSMINGVRKITAEREILRNTALREQEANKLKSTFLANMSHEIRTPMNAILGITEIQLRNENIPADIEEGLKKIYDSGNLLLNIINDILDLSKIEAGKLEIIPIKYDLPSLINDTVQLNLLRYESKPIEFSLVVDENTPLNIHGDELRLKQILGNILSNAFKYTDKGEVKMSVKSESVSDDDIMLIIQISDTGQGMSQEQLKLLFEEYVRFNMEANRTIIGTGLGMSITKRLLDLMNGEITVESEVNKGSIFTVRVPQKRINGIVCGKELSEKLRSFRFQSTMMSKKSMIHREHMPYGSVLIVDDIETNIYVAKGMLLPYGLNIDTASSGITAIEKVKEGKTYDIIFMDHMMPKMDGIETVKNIRETGYKGTIIALTANALVGQAEIFLQKGFDGYISKPIDSRELNQILNEFIKNKKSQTNEEVQQKTINETPMEQLFIMDAENAVTTLENINIKNPTDAELEDFEIMVHGMKSALNNIGETELSSFALKLEKAALEKNIIFLENETSAFIEKLKLLIKRINNESKQ